MLNGTRHGIQKCDPQQRYGQNSCSDVLTVSSKTLLTHPPHQMFTAVNNVAGQAGIVNTRDRHTLRLIISGQFIHR